MEAWEEMDRASKERIEHEFERRFAFGYQATESFTPPPGSRMFDVSHAWIDGKKCVEPLETELNEKCLLALRACVDPGERLAALNWWHQGYWFRPHVDFVWWTPLAWKVPILPDGDYYAFFPEDFRLGLFSHMKRETIAVWGNDLVHALEGDPPELLTRGIGAA